MIYYGIRNYVDLWEFYSDNVDMKNYYDNADIEI